MDSPVLIQLRLRLVERGWSEWFEKNAGCESCRLRIHGDGFGLPVLARRLANLLQDDLVLKLEVWRIPKSDVLQADGLERARKA